ncbi:MAG: hypothetical protein HQK60_09510 [Deltaproteobacteria bacterium]|nr:hypothetical protein [Deltaproteobacteria bacterium]
MKKVLTISGLIYVISMMITWSCVAGNRQLMSEKMAKQDLKRNLTEAVVGYKVKSQGEFGLTEDPNYKIEAKVTAIIKGVMLNKMIYDRDKDVALCIGYIDLGDVKNIVGMKIRFKNVRVWGYGLGTMSEASRPPLMAMRAALINAYDEMASTIVGEKISSYSQADNFVLTKDSNRSKVCAAVYGAFIPNVDIDSKNRGWGWDVSGNAFVKLQLDLLLVKDLLGNKIIYKGANPIEVIGRGSPVDDLKPSNPATTNLMSNEPAKTEYRSLGIPENAEAAPAQTAPPK